MIVDNKHKDFANMVLKDAHGAKIKLLIKSYDTEKEEAEIYIPVEPSLDQETEMQANIARTPKKSTGKRGGWKCEIVTAKVKIPGSYLDMKK